MSITKQTAFEIRSLAAPGKHGLVDLNLFQQQVANTPSKHNCFDRDVHDTRHVMSPDSPPHDLTGARISNSYLNVVPGDSWVGPGSTKKM